MHGYSRGDIRAIEGRGGMERGERKEERERRERRGSMKNRIISESSMF